MLYSRQANPPSFSRMNYTDASLKRKKEKKVEVGSYELRKHISFGEYSDTGIGCQIHIEKC